MKQPQGQIPILKPAVLLIILVCLIYSNSLNCSWHLDDYHNIPENSAIQITKLDASAIKNSFYAAPNKENLARPIAFLTFALNWYFGENDPAGYRVVNIAVHVLSALFLFFSVFLLFQTPNLKGWNQNSIYFIALLTAALWAIHPIQIQAVTYIVQRMASMAALFYIIGIFCYVKARLSVSKCIRVLFFGFCGLSFLLGIGSKHNAILLPISIVLLEFTFFRDLAQKKTQKVAASILISGAILVAVTGIFLFMDGNLGGLFKGYENRTFTLYQRLLTQPSIVLFYLSQIFYPIVSRFSIAHEFTVSSSLFTPWYTLPAILLILAMIVFALLRIRKNPVLSFAILFFFGNHVIESSIIPLEMVFEHRNYLPTLFLFFPIAIGIKKALDYYRPVQKSMFCFLVIAVCGVMISLGTSTYVRNWDWRSEKSIWEDAMEKAPSLARPAQNLAWGHYQPTGQTEKAITLYEKALDLHDDKKGFKYYSYNNLAGIYFSKGDYKKAGKYAAKALEIQPGKVGLNMMFCNSLAMLDHYDAALEYVNNLIEEFPNTKKYLYFKGFLLLKRAKPEKALELFRQCLQVSSDNSRYLREIGLCFTKMGYYDRGYWFLKRAQEVNPYEIGILLGLANNRIRKEKHSEADQWIKSLIRVTGVSNIEQKLMQIAEDPMGIPFSHKKVALFVSKHLKDRAEKYTEIALSLENEPDSAK